MTKLVFVVIRQILKVAEECIEEEYGVRGQKLKWYGLRNLILFWCVHDVGRVFSYIYLTVYIK